jgi:serine/threonine protein phosphatase PrpC
MKFSIYQETRRGTRRNNQDRVGYSYSRDALLMIVADGLGGHLHGEIASHIAVQYMTEAFQREAQTKLSNPLQFLQLVIIGAHNAIIDYARGKSLPDTPRTTCVACVVQDGLAHWAHVGDSRLYHVREGSVQLRTKDHTRVQSLVDTGRIREEAMNAHPERNRVLNCLGSPGLPYVDLGRATLLHAGDTLLLCSDGLWGPLSATMITQALDGAELARAVPALMDLAELRSGPDCDNLSAVAVTWGEDAVIGSATDVSTVELKTVTTQVQDFASTTGDFLTDEEIESAIREIRTAIRKNALK